MECFHYELFICFLIMFYHVRYGANPSHTHSPLTSQCGPQIVHKSIRVNSYDLDVVTSCSHVQLCIYICFKKEQMCFI